MKNITNHVSSKFGLITVLSQWVDKENRYRLMGLCKCDCGEEKVVRIAHLVSGVIISCGCYGTYRRRSLSKRHGHSGTLQHHSWKGMRARCKNTKNTSYKDYGGRGIKVCDRWMSYDNFIADMGEPPSPQHSIERINNNGNYEPSNCRWATKKEQANNRRKRIDAKEITYNGVTKSIPEWAKISNLTYQIISRRLNEGWDVETILTKPRIG